MVGYIKEAVDNIIADATWLDSATKRQAKLKVNILLTLEWIVRKFSFNIDLLIVRGLVLNPNRLEKSKTLP